MAPHILQLFKIIKKIYKIYKYFSAKPMYTVNSYISHTLYTGLDVDNNNFGMVKILVVLVPEPAWTSDFKANIQKERK